MALSLKKGESTVVSSTHTFESAYVECPLKKLWPLVKDLAFDKLFPSKVKSVKYLSGNPG